jgi:hypothetical protein
MSLFNVLNRASGREKSGWLAVNLCLAICMGVNRTIPPSTVGLSEAAR